MITKQYRILEPFVKEPWKKFTFKEIKRQTHNRSDNYVHKGLKQFVSLEILQEQKVGNNILYFFANFVFARESAGFIAEKVAHETKYLPHDNLFKLINKIKTVFFIFLITGSYAKKKYTSKSDVDVVIICDSKRETKSILAQIKLESELMIPEVHPHVFTQDEFYQMILSSEENYGKEITRNNLIIAGGREYYSIILEAVQHGFNG